MPPSRTATRPPQRQQRGAPPTPETAIQQYGERASHPIVQYIEKQMPSIAAMLPRSMPPARFQATLLQALLNNPDVLSCTPQSIVKAVMQAAQEGIALTGQPGGGYLVPFRPEQGAQPEATLLRDYRALIRMAIRSGAATKIESAVVRHGEHFAYVLGDEPRIEHTPDIGSKAAGIAYYAIAALPDGSKQREVMTRDQVEHIRQKSRMRDSGPWRNDFDQMARKTVIRRLINYLALSPEQRELIDREERIEFGDDAMPPVVRVSVPQHGDLRERAAQRAALLAGGTEQPEQAAAAASGASDAERAQTAPAPVQAAEAAPVAETTLEDATKAVFATAKAHNLIDPANAEAAWAYIDTLAHEAIPDVDPEELTVADWLAIRDRIDAGEFAEPAARPGSAS